MITFFACRVAVSVVRAEASDKSEIITQLLFGDRVELIERRDKWCKIKTHHDHYEGWLDEKQIIELSEAEYHQEDQYQYMSPAQELNKIIDADGHPLYLSPGSTLPFYKDGNCKIGNLSFQVNFEPIIPQQQQFYQNIAPIAQFFLNAPYLWGGRNVFGIDCSGFSQIVYKLNGIALARDAYQQAEQGELVDFLAHAQLGDLAFFDNEEGRITHVGIMLNNHEIIHAAGRVHIDPIDNQGIYSKELGRYTHKLRIIKRLAV